MNEDLVALLLFLLAGLTIVVVIGTSQGIRIWVALTDISIGWNTLLYPRWALEEFMGKILPYFFDDEYESPPDNYWDITRWFGAEG